MSAVVLDGVRDLLASAADDGRVVAVGWATVDLDRAAAELADRLGVTAASFLPADDSVALGARCRVAAAVLADGLSLAILFPITEGRLAATLARHGEGPAITWSVAGPGAPGSRARPRPGPFGPERLVPGAPTDGPHRFLIGTAPGTIRP